MKNGLWTSDDVWVLDDIEVSKWDTGSCLYFFFYTAPDHEGWMVSKSLKTPPVTQPNEALRGLVKALGEPEPASWKDFDPNILRGRKCRLEFTEAEHESKQRVVRVLPLKTETGRKGAGAESIRYRAMDYQLF